MTTNEIRETLNELSSHDEAKLNVYLETDLQEWVYQIMRLNKIRITSEAKRLAVFRKTFGHLKDYQEVA